MRAMPVRRRGFTLVETIVALVLLEIAMLALAATAAVAARDLSDALIRRRAFDVARNRADALRPRACSSVATGVQALPGGLVEHWSVEAVGSAREIADSVVVPLTRGHRTALVSRGWRLCGP
jgi:Tfp pilus assembly protein PilV